MEVALRTLGVAESYTNNKRIFRIVYIKTLKGSGIFEEFVGCRGSRSKKFGKPCCIALIKCTPTTRKSNKRQLR